MKNSTLSTTGT